MERIESASPEATVEVGRILAARMMGGDMVLLRGTIGAGKSVLARGIGEALGIVNWEGSPTFTLVNEYSTLPRLYHIDLYRLSTLEVQELGLEEYVRQDSIVVVEWADRAPVLLGDIAVREPIWVDVLGGFDDRRDIVIHPPGRHEPPDPATR